MRVSAINYQNQMNKIHCNNKSDNALNFKAGVSANEIYNAVVALQKEGSPKLQGIANKLLNEISSQSQNSTYTISKGLLLEMITAMLSVAGINLSAGNSHDTEVSGSQDGEADDSFAREWQNYFKNFSKNSANNKYKNKKNDPIDELFRWVGRNNWDIRILKKDEHRDRRLYDPEYRKTHPIYNYENDDLY